MTLPRSFSCALLVIPLAACGGDVAGDPPPVPMIDATEASGLDFRPEIGAVGAFDLPEIMSGGAAILDANRDGSMDVLLVNAGEDAKSARPPRGASPHVLFLGKGDGTFLRGPDLPAARGYGMGIAVADFDGDGVEDCYLTARGPDALWLGKGDGAFVDVSEAWGVPQDTGWSTSAAPFDADGDGDLDLFVVRYLTYDPALICHDGAGRPSYCPPQASPAERDVFLRNEGGRFVDASQAFGLESAPAGPGLGVVIEDLDGDGRDDVFVANDGRANHLWLAKGDGAFEESAVLLGVAFNQSGAAEAGMGVVSTDFDGDGTQDLFLTHLQEETHTLYQRSGRRFRDATARAGLVQATMPHTGFGVGLLDLEPDGDADLIIANGRVRLGEPMGTLLSPPWSELAEPDSLLVNDGKGGFVPSDAAPLSEQRISRGIAVGDLNGDLVPDAVRTHVLSPAQVLLVQPREPLEQRLLLDVRHANGAVALGARVSTPSGIERRVRANQGYLCSHDPRLLIADLTGPVDVEVSWPNGKREAFGPLQPGRAWTLIEGEGAPR